MCQAVALPYTSRVELQSDKVIKASSCTRIGASHALEMAVLTGRDHKKISD